jgi:hypothetical protein
MWKRRVAVVAQVDALQQLFPTAARVAEEEKEKKNEREKKKKKMMKKF